MLGRILFFVSIVIVGATRVAVIPLPEWGHFNPMSVVAEELLERKLDVGIFVPDMFKQSCAGAFPNRIVDCQSYGTLSHAQYDDKFFEAITEQAPIETFEVIDREMRSAQFNVTAPVLALVSQFEPDVLLCDVAFHITGAIIADRLNIPLVLLWPLVLQLPGNSNPRVPALIAAVPQQMSWMQFLWNAVIQRVSLLGMRRSAAIINDFRRTFDLAPVDPLSPFSDRIIIAPSIFGLDISQQLCPNIIPVGLLQSKPTSSPLPEEWEAWFKKCGTKENGTVYINMGSVGRLPAKWVNKIEDALLALPPDTCVLWKISQPQHQALRSLPNRPNTRTSTWLPFSPRELMRSHFVSVFMTHCGDTSVYESIESGVPLVGFPLFADQPDVCQRVQDAELGTALEKSTSTSADIQKAIVNQRTRFGAVQVIALRLRETSALQGEAKSAANVVQIVSEQGAEPFRCRRRLSDPITFFDLDVTATTLAVTFLAWTMLSLIWGCMRGQK